MKNNKIVYFGKMLVKNKVIVSILSILIMVMCVYLSFARNHTERTSYRKAILNEINTLSNLYVQNSDKLMDVVGTYIDDYAIEFDDNSDLHELFKDCTERQKNWTSISMYVDAYMDGFENWSDHRKNSEVTILIGIYKNRLVEYVALKDLILEREAMYTTMDELEALLEESE